MNKNEIVKNALDELQKAIKRFGEYSFDDKGPNEVMNIGPIVRNIKTLSTEDMIDALITIGSSDVCEGRGFYLASCLVGDMEDIDEIFENISIVKLYNREYPFVVPEDGPSM